MMNYTMDYTLDYTIEYMVDYAIVKMQGDLGLQDSCVGVPLLEISFVSLGNRPNA